MHVAAERRRQVEVDGTEIEMRDRQGGAADAGCRAGVARLGGDLQTLVTRYPASQYPSSSRWAPSTMTFGAPSTGRIIVQSLGQCHYREKLARLLSKTSLRDVVGMTWSAWAIQVMPTPREST